MKDKIILFIIGVLVGAIISTGAFYFYVCLMKESNFHGRNVQQILSLPCLPIATIRQRCCSTEIRTLNSLLKRQVL